MRRWLTMATVVTAALVVASSCALTLVRATPAHAAGVAGLGQYRVISYIPAGGGDGLSGQPYDEWIQWSPTTLNTDFGLISSLHADAVRIFVGVEDTGATYPAVSPTFTQHLATLMSLAEQNGLKVVLSLFSDYPQSMACGSACWSDVSSAEAWMQSVVSPYANSPELAYVELRNEIDAPCYTGNDPEAWGPEAVTWLESMIPALRNDIGSVPIVLSQNASPTTPAPASTDSCYSTLKNASEPPAVAGYEALDAALPDADRPDAYSFHLYESASLLYGVLSTLESGLSRPVFVGETGFPTDTGFTGEGASQLAANSTVRMDYQARFLQEAAAVTTNMGLGFPGIWTLWDLTHGSSADQDSFGLLTPKVAPNGTTTTSGSQFGYTIKPGGQLISNVFYDGVEGRNVPAPGMNTSFDDASAGAPTALPSPWSNSGLATVDDVTDPHSGTYDVCSTSGSSDSYLYTMAPMTGTISGTHTLSAYVRGGDQTTSIQVRWVGLDGTELGTYTISAALSGPASAWTHLEISGSAPPQAVAARVVLQTDTNACFDDVVFG